MTLRRPSAPSVDKATRVVVQGITGSAGSFHARQLTDYGTAVVAGVTPGPRSGTRTASSGVAVRFEWARAAPDPAVEAP